jgi:hypothetical protein
LRKTNPKKDALAYRKIALLKVKRRKPQAGYSFLAAKPASPCRSLTQPIPPSPPVSDHAITRPLRNSQSACFYKGWGRRDKNSGGQGRQVRQMLFLILHGPAKSPKTLQPCQGFIY